MRTLGIGSLTILFVSLAACGGGEALTIPIAFPPTITGVQPPGGPTAGGAVITVTGTNFTSLTSVTVGGALCLNVNVPNTTTLTCTVPAGSVGAKDVVVSTATGSATAAGAYTYVAALLEAPTKGHAPVLDVLIQDAAGSLVAVLEDVLNGVSGDGRWYGAEPFSALAAVAAAGPDESWGTAGGHTFGLDPEFGVLFWFAGADRDDLAGFPHGWCLAPELRGADRVLVLAR